MKDYRLYLYPILLVLNLFIITVLFSISWIYSLLALGVFIYTAADLVYLYLSYTWWPYHNWISTNIVDIEKIEIQTTMEGQKIKAVVIRPKNLDKSKKTIGVLFHHGYTGKKEKAYRFAIPLAMNGCVVLCPDARGHGENKKNKKLSMNDFKGIMEDVEKEIDYLENIPEVDKNKLLMMGHSMGGIMTLSAGYRDQRIKKLVAISAPYDMLGMFEKHKSVATNFIHRNVTNYVKKSPEFIQAGVTVEEYTQKISAKYVFNEQTSIPDKDRVYLVHCKQDDLVIFSEAEDIKKHLKLPDENCLFLDEPPWKYWMAAHNLTGQATIIAAFCVQVALSLNNP